MNKKKKIIIERKNAKNENESQKETTPQTRKKGKLEFERNTRENGKRFSVTEKFKIRERITVR